MKNENQKIDKILQDLYKIDPNLKKQEKKLKEIIKKLLTFKPEIEINQEFVKDLRKKLLKGDNKQVKFKINYMSKFIYAGIGMIVMALILVPYYNNKNNNINFHNLVKNSGINIENVEEKAFGSLASISNYNVGSLENSDGENREIGVTGMGSAQINSSDEQVEGRDRIMPMPTPVVYEYKYVGDDFEIKKDKTVVFKRIKDSNVLANNLISLDNLDIGKIDYAKFSNLQINSISLYEDKDSGYRVSIDNGEKKVSIYKNWETWSQENSLNKRLKIADVPSDENIITVANTFIENYNLDMSPYGEAIVDKAWLEDYQRAENKEKAYIPYTMTVIYPLIMDGKEVYNEYRNKYGLSVQVDFRNNKVSSVNEIVEHDYQSSDYEVVQDEDRIIDIVERGGYRNYNYRREGENVEKKIVELGSPSLEMVRVWKNSPNVSEELYVEAYIFPVLNSDDNNFYRDYLIVPIVEDLVLEDEKQNNNISNNTPELLPGNTSIIQPRNNDFPSVDKDEKQGSGSNMEIQILN